MPWELGEGHRAKIVLCEPPTSSIMCLVDCQKLMVYLDSFSTLSVGWEMKKVENACINDFISFLCIAHYIMDLYKLIWAFA